MCGTETDHSHEYTEGGASVTDPVIDHAHEAGQIESTDLCVQKSSVNWANIPTRFDNTNNTSNKSSVGCDPVDTFYGNEMNQRYIMINTGLTSCDQRDLANTSSNYGMRVSDNCSNTGTNPTEGHAHTAYATATNGGHDHTISRSNIDATTDPAGSHTHSNPDTFQTGDHDHSLNPTQAGGGHDHTDTPAPAHVHGNDCVTECWLICNGKRKIKIS